MNPLLCRQRVVFGPGRAELRLEPQLGVLLHEGSPVLAVPAALAVAGVRAEKVALEALAVALEAGGLLAVAAWPLLFIFVHGEAMVRAEQPQTGAGGRSPMGRNSCEL